jgi:DNA-binding LacI/PurR family transcriptional regulator
MTAADQVPLCAQTKQAGGAIVLITGHPPYGEEAIAALASHLPCVHLFSPNHPVPAIDHVTINDVAIGHLAFKTLQEAGCQSYAVITTSEVLHQALLVRGRAFLVRAFEQKEQALCFAKPMDAGDPSRVWPQPLTVFEDFSEIIDKIANLPRPVGIFLTLEVHAAQLHALLKEANLLKNSAVQLIIAGTTPQYVQTLDPAPILIDLRFPELINAAIHQLMHRSQQTGAQHLTLQLPPSIKSIQPS